MTTRGCAHLFWFTLRMKWRSICSVTSKSAITPSLSGRMALMEPGCAAEHALGLGAYGVDFSGTMVDGDHGRLGEHDAAAADVDEGVGCAEVDGNVTRAKAGEVIEETDDLLLSVGSIVHSTRHPPWRQARGQSVRRSAPPRQGQP